MLLPDRVRSFLLHDDPHVRDHAARYFAHASDPTPVTADDLWAIVDRPVPDDLPFPVYWASKLPQTDASVHKTLDILAAGTAGREARWLIDGLNRLDMDLLERHGQAVRACAAVPPETTAHHEARRRLRDAEPTSLWRELADYADAIAEQHEDQFDRLRIDRLIEGLARHPGFSADVAMGWLTDPAKLNTWHEVFAARLVGAMRYRPAVDALFEKLRIDGEIMNDRSVDALVGMADAGLIARLEAGFAGEPKVFRLYAHDLFRRVHLPESEAALVRLLPAEPDPLIRTILAADICEACSTEGLELVRQMIVRGDYDETYDKLDERLLLASAITGFSFPEAEGWRSAVNERWRERGRAMAELGKAVDAGGLEDWLSEGADGPSDENLWDATPIRGEDDERLSPPAVTLHREAPRIGRNDPCPCGSGKKYKKCCLRAVSRNP